MADDINKKFQFDKYAIPTIKNGGEELITTYIDGSDSLANKGFVISFYHLPSKKSVYFKAFITTFNETYVPDWAAETVYGRSDPIYLYKNTTRKISLAFKVPAGSSGEAYENLAKVQTLLQFLYPSYSESDNANTISQSPLTRLKVMNLLQKATGTTEEEETPDDTNSKSENSLYTNYKSTSDDAPGLLGVLDNVTVSHNLENTDYGVIERPNGTVLPKLIEINLGFSAIHEHTVGWNESGNFVNSLFPYGALQAEEETELQTDAGAVNWDPDLITELGLGIEDQEYLTDAQKSSLATEQALIMTPAEQAAFDENEAKSQEVLTEANGN